MLAASVIAGSLWDAGGAKVTFLAGACFTLMVLIRLLTIRGRINTKVATAVRFPVYHSIACQRLV
jgi:hypothetical protein